MVVDKPAAAKEAFATGGWETSEEDIVQVVLADKPGALGSVASKLGEVGINIDYAYSGSVRSTLSNFGAALVHLAAPGEGIITTYPGKHYAAGWGTSFSTPFVSAAVVLLLQVEPAITQVEVSIGSPTRSFSRGTWGGDD